MCVATSAFGLEYFNSQRLKHIHLNDMWAHGANMCVQIRERIYISECWWQKPWKMLSPHEPVSERWWRSGYIDGWLVLLFAGFSIVPRGLACFQWTWQIVWNRCVFVITRTGYVLESQSTSLQNVSSFLYMTYPHSVSAQFCKTICAISKNIKHTHTSPFE